MAVVFSDPQLAQAGLRFKELPKQCVAFGEVDFANQGRSRVMLKNRGKLRVYVHKDGGRFLGAEMAGPGMEHIADRKSTRLEPSHECASRMPSSDCNKKATTVCLYQHHYITPS